MRNERMYNSVRNLMNLYTVVIGVALTVAIGELIPRSTGLSSVSASAVMLFGALIVTMIPFYHGAMRHLDDAYIENENPHIRLGALVVDFALLFTHSIVFVALALLMYNPNHFIWTLLALLVVDIVWGVFVVFGSSTRVPGGAEGRWTIVNVVFVGIAALYLVSNAIYFEPVANAEDLSALVAIACVLRTLCDYFWCRAFYFPL